ncbi:MAG TPA: kynureninase [Sphingomonas sp.]|nr:kynureninase [Sphingomonas sp.]
MLSLDAARVRDAADPFAEVRDAFALPDDLIYLDGNSLGALPRATAPHVALVVQREWGEGLIRSWNTHRWIDAARDLGARIAPLVGAAPDELLVADSTSVNLFKLIAAACRAAPDRHVILSEPGNFPTDLYVAQGVAGMLPGRVVRTVAADAIADAIDADTAVVLLTHVHYKTGRKLDMAVLTAAAHAKGALIVWDLSHSVGAVAVDLNGCGADLAVGCGYKYLNGGPGAPAFLYVARALQARLHSPLSGWMGHAAPFAFGDDYAPAPGIGRFQCGTPPTLALAALAQGIAPFHAIDAPALFAKGQALCDLYIGLVEARCPALRLVTPRDAAARGSHVSFAHAQAYAICQALIARGVIGDFRDPDILRMGFTPLYTRFADVWRAVDVLADVIATQAWDDPAYRVRATVT